MPPNPAPVADEPRAFAVDELFFSTTDPRGIITSGNEVFVRISGYSTAELVGRAHNIIRHPDMPRAAFRLVWDRLKAGQPAAALVKNRAKDGRHYWVVALITPTPTGYLSVRFKPSGPLLATTEALYAQMVAAETRAGTTGANPRTVMDAGARVLTEALGGLKFANYEAFMWVLLCEELRHRDAALAREHRGMVRALPADLVQRTVGRPALQHLAGIYHDGCRAYAQLNRLYQRLDEFVALGQKLDNKTSFVNNLTNELRISSINVALASTKLGGEGLALAVISRHMGETSVDVAGSVHRLVSGIHALSGRLRGVIFDIAAARLQMEMSLTFLHELIAGETPADTWLERRGLIRILHDAFSTTLGQATQALRDLAGTVHPLSLMAGDLEKAMLSLHVAQVGAMVECAQISSQGDFLDIFVCIREQIDKTHAELLDLGEALHHLDRLADETPPLAGEIGRAAVRMDDGIVKLPNRHEAPSPPPTPSSAASRPVAGEAEQRLGTKKSQGFLRPWKKPAARAEIEPITQ